MAVARSCHAISFTSVDRAIPSSVAESVVEIDAGGGGGGAELLPGP